MSTVKPCWGYFCFPSGLWQPNYELAMTPGQQREENIKNGHICYCGYHYLSCKCKLLMTKGANE